MVRNLDLVDQRDMRTFDGGFVVAAQLTNGDTVECKGELEPEFRDVVRKLQTTPARAASTTTTCISPALA
jgi:hypothetical protein